ncbi:MAG: SpoIIE family protein phosphatase [Phycisphaerales bacterium]|nr:SpoIIE family protein phosphatase [Phycisphaerales bacterium]
MTPLLQFMDSGGASRTLELSQRPIRIGRSAECELTVPGNDISREHAEVFLSDNGSIMVTDLNSKNGTRVDGGAPFRNTQRVAYRAIRVGDFEIQIVNAPRLPLGVVKFQEDDRTTDSGGASFYPSSQRIDLNQQRLTMVLALIERLSGKFDRRELLEHALDVVCETMNFERGLILLKAPRGEMEPPVVRNVPQDESGAYRVSRSVINRALLDGQRAVINKGDVNYDANFSESMVLNSIRTALCVPIIHRDQILGAIYGDRITAAKTYMQDDVDFLAAIAQQIGIGLSNVRMLQERVRSERMAADLNQAGSIQRNLLPTLPLATGRIVIEGCNEPCSEVGGDYFDYLELPDGRVGFIIADVSGHGLASALVMANVQAAVRVALMAGGALPQVASIVNRLICHNTRDSAFVTAILGTIEPETGRMEFICAGHPAPLVFECDESGIAIGESSMIWGTDPEATYELHRIDPRGAAVCVLFFTDGLFEALNHEEKALGIGAIQTSLADCKDRCPAETMRAARAVLHAHLDGLPSRDDMTMLVVRYLGAESAKRE